MKKETKLIVQLVVLFVLIILAASFLWIKIVNDSKEELINDKGCVPSQCCHASECVSKQDAPTCSNSFCTMECREGTMDCGAGHCEYLNGKCGVVWNEK